VRKSVIYLEGGGGSSLDARCQEGFNKLLQAMGFAGRMPKLIVCGGRGQAFDRFKTALKEDKASFIGLWIDSEDPVGLNKSNTDSERDKLRVWDHLRRRDRWDRPHGAEDKQVLLMVTCMETWIAADRPACGKHYKTKFRENALPALTVLENKHRHDVQDALETATTDCSNAFKKGKQSFEILGQLQPEELSKHLGSFNRVQRILAKELK